jgi:hypothetical protein
VPPVQNQTPLSVRYISDATAITTGPLAFTKGIADFSWSFCLTRCLTDLTVPDAVKEAFNAAFAGRNKSAVIAGFMMRAVEDEQKREIRARAIDRLLARRSTKRSVSSQKIRAPREALRS